MGFSFRSRLEGWIPRLRVLSDGRVALPGGRRGEGTEEMGASFGCWVWGNGPAILGVIGWMWLRDALCGMDTRGGVDGCGRAEELDFC